MIKIPITFQTPDDAVQFVNIVSRYDVDVDLRYGHHIVDAKSLVGTLALSSAKNIQMIIHDNECMELVQEVGPFVSRRMMASRNSHRPDQDKAGR
ncbi:HPr family phosphocarrier protein [Robinsoniella peoriensis]|uniref:HPr family phosphocarrier protein n=1 Tax=Robinsoniella peoriensis TaxID=180332 RepID=UPI0005C7A72F|nr:HPr family phosphocarrier protein [Robinsoniella peoriensis]